MEIYLSPLTASSPSDKVKYPPSCPLYDRRPVPVPNLLREAFAGKALEEGIGGRDFVLPESLANEIDRLKLFIMPFIFFKVERREVIVVVVVEEGTLSSCSSKG